ncbi:MAG: glycosyl hydrolase family 28 protein [Firmicutes bacterium]|nr:glycosyl hydrolase family 28 protein [Bacillota bacterium]
MLIFGLIRSIKSKFVIAIALSLLLFVFACTPPNGSTNRCDYYYCDCYYECELTCDCQDTHGNGNNGNGNGQENGNGNGKENGGDEEHDCGYYDCECEYCETDCDCKYFSGQQMDLRLGTVTEGAPIYEGALSVFVEGQELQMHRVMVSNQRVWTAIPTRVAAAVGYVYLSGGDARIIIDFGTDVSFATIRPLAREIVPTVQGSRIIFTTNGTGTYIIEPNGDYRRAVFIFVDEYSCERPPPNTQNIIVFEPGLHDAGNSPHINTTASQTNPIDRVTLQSNTTVVIEEGAVVRAQFFGSNVHNVRITGRGIIDGSTFVRQFPLQGVAGRQTVPIEFQHSSNIILEDFAVHDPAGWVVHFFFVRDSLICGIRMFTSRSNGDGVSLQSNRNVTVRGVFVRAWDDALVVKNYPTTRHGVPNGVTYNILFEDCEIWVDLAQAMEIGYETVGEVMRDITFRNITVFHAFHQAVMSINNANNANIQNILWENIVVENASMGMGSAGTTGRVHLIHMRNIHSATWSDAWGITPLGQIDGVTIRNVQVLDDLTFNRQRVHILAWGVQEGRQGFERTGHYVRNVTIEDVYFRGERVTEENAVFTRSANWVENFVIR